MAVNITPLHDRVLVRRTEEKETVKGGIIIPDTAPETLDDLAVTNRLVHWLRLARLVRSPIVTAPAIELPNSRSIAYRSAGFLMPRRWVSRSRWRPSSAYPPKRLLAAGDGAFSRTDPNNSSA